ncbi:MAG: GyrI-like domain-containing protein [Flavobacterium sp.]|nr:GyrI-like domain-containing protein [Flavobacterium sp.]
MRILKYLFLIFILLFIGAFVFVTTQKANYEVEKSEIIKIKKSTAFNFINDFRNWETFYFLESNNKKLIYSYPNSTIGIGSSFSWSGLSEGSVKTTALKENDSISQKMSSNQDSSYLIWKFKDTLGGTKVTIKRKGTLDFKYKLLTFFNGGINNVMGCECENILLNLNKSLVYEINTYSIKINGFVNKSGSFYLKQTLLCREKSIIKNIKILMPKLKSFVTKNKIIMNGKPFVIYDKYDGINDLIKLSVCIPVRDSIFISEGSDIQSGKFSSYNTIKATLTGDYSHCQKAWLNINNFISKNKLERDNSHKIIEIYTKSYDEIKNPSKWITEIYIPVYSRPIVKSEITKIATDSSSIKSPKIVN